MSNVQFSKRRFTLTALLFAAANQMGCQPADSAPSAMQAVLSVQLAGADYGSVKSDPAGIDCGATCSAAFPTGTSVTLTATASSQGSFLTWGGSCQGSAATCTVSVAASTLATAEFTQLVPPVDSPPAITGIAPFYAAKAGGTTVTITGSGFQTGSQVTIAGTAAISVTYVSATQLQATVPAGTQAGCAAVVVKNPDNQQGSIARALAYKPTTTSFATAASTAALASSPIMVRAGDYDRDGKIDLLVAAASGKIQYLQGVGDGTFGAPADVFSDSDFSGLAVADFNKDGKLDAVALSKASGKVFVLMGAGDGTFTKTNEYVTGAMPYGLTVGDVNGDSVDTYRSPRGAA